jgi:hypothetical protein
LLFQLAAAQVQAQPEDQAAGLAAMAAQAARLHRGKVTLVALQHHQETVAAAVRVLLVAMERVVVVETVEQEVHLPSLVRPLLMRAAVVVVLLVAQVAQAGQVVGVMELQTKLQLQQALLTGGLVAVAVDIISVDQGLALEVTVAQA